MEKELKEIELDEVAGGKVFKNKMTGKWHTNWHPAEEFNSKKDAKKCLYNLFTPVPKKMTKERINYGKQNE